MIYRFLLPIGQIGEEEIKVTGSGRTDRRKRRYRF